MAAIKKEIEEAEAKGEIPKGLTRKLKTLEKRDKEFEKNLARIRKAAKNLLDYIVALSQPTQTVARRKSLEKSLKTVLEAIYRLKSEHKL